MKFKVHFADIAELQRFVAEVNTLDCDVNLFDNHKCFDAKSVVALVNLDLTKEFVVDVISDNKQILEAADKIISEYT